jgi:hypothetical protein
MQCDERANGSEIEAEVGENFEVLLPETRTAGYRGVIKRQRNLLASCWNSWPRRTQAAGAVPLRAWEDPEKPPRTFVITMRIRS